MIKRIDSVLNRVTTYRFVLYFLAALVLVAEIFTLFGILQFSPKDLILDTSLAVIVCVSVNHAVAKIVRAETSTESSLITALILVLIIPTAFPANLLFFMVASAAAVASKYILVVEKQHIFNPVAVSVLALSFLAPSFTATWWVGTPAMLPFVLVGGLLLARKMRDEIVVLTFLALYLVVVADATIINNGLGSVFSALSFSVQHSAVLFFAFVMLTEPSTMPHTKGLRSYFAALVAILYAMPQFQFSLAWLALTPEAALSIGNIFSYVVKPKYRMALPLIRQEQISPDTFSLEFSMTEKMRFKPGQYMEWALPHSHSDSRGTRRYFSIASSPTERNILLVVKVPGAPSSYKKAMLNLKKNETIIAGKLAGDFVMPQDLHLPLVFIAGGVGIAPFRSMAKYIVDRQLKCEITLIYSNWTEKDILFRDLFDEAARFGLRTVYTLTDISSVPSGWVGSVGYITKDMIKKEIPDYKIRTFYISGPQPMVQSLERTVNGLNIKGSQVITDYFPGYNENVEQSSAQPPPRLGRPVTISR